MNKNHTGKAKTRKEIAEEYGVHPKTLNRWFKKYNFNLPTGKITPKDLIKIYSTFGTP